MTVHIIHADVLAGLAQLESDSVNTVVTSPPYHGMRDYGTGTWEGGDAGCEHVEQSFGKGRGDGKFYDGGKPRELEGGRPILGPICKCGARRVDDQIGLEPTLAEHIDKLVQVFAEVRRVLRPDGVAFVNYGDVYASTSGSGQCAKPMHSRGANTWDGAVRGIHSGLKPKDNMLIPERLSVALQEAGWWVRDRIVWAKPNPMPSSVTDRCTPSYELIYVLAKNGASPTFWLHEHGKGSRTRPEPDYVWTHKDTGEERSAPPAGDDPYLPKWKRRNLWRGVAYWWDAEAIRERWADERNGQPGSPSPKTARIPGQSAHTIGSKAWTSEHQTGRNARNVWTIATAPFPSAHFATFPPELVRRCLLAACPERVCASCGAGWVREVERGELTGGAKRRNSDLQDVAKDERLRTEEGWNSENGYGWGMSKPTKTLGWHPSCDCQAETRPGTCLDPFGGSGTVPLVADRMNRDATMIELSAEYVAMARKRIEGDAPLFADLPEHEPAPQPAEQGGLFDEG